MYSIRLGRHYFAIEFGQFLALSLPQLKALISYGFFPMQLSAVRNVTKLTTHVAVPSTCELRSWEYILTKLADYQSRASPVGTHSDDALQDDKIAVESRLQDAINSKDQLTEQLQSSKQQLEALQVGCCLDTTHNLLSCTATLACHM